MAGSKFYKQIHTAKEEREVDAVYTKGLNLYFKGVDITHPFKCDSYLDTATAKGKNLRLLVEYKYDENFALKAGIAKVLSQVVFYLKRFEINGMPLPNVVLVGDINECFVLQTNVLQSYLDFEDIDWNKAPSEAHALFPQLVAALARDENISPFVFDIDDNFSFKTVADSIIDQADNVQRFVRVTEHNIAVIYDHFCNRVVKDQKKIHPNELVSIFIGTILDADNYYQHPKNLNKLVTLNGSIDIVGSAFSAFISVFEREYTPDERRRFAEISDRLVEETKRRRSGEFYTPTPFVDYAHQMLAEELGDDWKDKYVVWDCCWGTGNLTRDYRFKELYASTFEPSELAIGANYNREAQKFIFDFLNDEVEDMFGVHVPEGLLLALKENKPILFFINPPYAKNTGDGKLAGTSEDVCYTKVRQEMNKVGLDACVANLYAQFIYRILMLKEQYKLTNLHLALYSPTLFLTGISWKTFRKVLFSKFDYSRGIVFKASCFADVADSWGISFTIWNPGQTIKKNEFSLNLVENGSDGVVSIGQKILYNIDDSTTASTWVREETKRLKTYDSINLTSAIKVREKDGQRKGMIVQNALGYFYNAGNNVDKNVSHIAMFTAACSLGIGNSVIPSNFYKCATLFSARKLISKNWINSKDEYLAPNENHEKWEEYVNDSIIYSLFHTSSNQSSLRNKEYKGKSWQIYNEFFFMAKKEIMELAEKYKLYETYEEARTDKERYVYELLLQKTLSSEAKGVWDKACDITRKTFEYRELFNEEHPEYQIQNWDCGWYQIKALAKQYAKTDMDEFDILYKALADKMRPMVYELGFLKR